LPTFPAHDGKKYTAIVTGANGISGSEITNVLAASPGRWETDEERYTVATMPRDPPPRGFGPPGKVKIAFSFEVWAQKPEVKDAWEKIKERSGLKELDPWRERSVLQNVFGTLDGEMLGSWSRRVLNLLFLI
jgi:hypothetical protein